MVLRKLSPRIWTYAGQERPAGVPSTDLAIRQIESAAFGDGSHPTTCLCAGALDVLVRTQRPDSVLDVGTGTGILARIARLRKVARVAATDIDPTALAAARQNIALDAPTVAIELKDVLPDHWGPAFDIIVANILEGPLCALAPHLARGLRPGGQLLTSGFTPPQMPAIRYAFVREGLRHHGEAHLDEWVLSTFFRSDEVDAPSAL